MSLNNGAVIDALTENNFDGGSIQIKADNLNLSNGGKIVTSGDSGGDAGNITLDVADTITLDNGNPPVNTPFLEPILQNTAGETGIFASSVAGSIGNGGSIDVRAGSIEFINNGAIAAVTQAGTGGNITINAESLLGIEARPLNNLTNDINASSKFDLDGTVNINTPDVNPTDGATELPVNRIKEQNQVAQTCSSNQAIGIANNLLLTGKGGLSTSPVAPLSSESIIEKIEHRASAAKVEGHQEVALDRHSPRQDYPRQRNNEN